jgi:hypothetical protein
MPQSFSRSRSRGYRTLASQITIIHLDKTTGLHAHLGPTETLVAEMGASGRFFPGATHIRTVVEEEELAAAAVRGLASSRLVLA